ncbi:hypothetical protein, partial [Stenotrophomonas sp. SMYL11]|uniref:hypothetical protein n=1 Tax=Stenotrophomonas sp. SMYL11 TaxID=3076042 RepID=UPI002E7605D6
MAQGEALGSEGWEGSGRLGGDPAVNIIYIMRNGIRRFGQRWSSFVGSAWQWLGLWLGSCLRPGTPAKD